MIQAFLSAPELNLFLRDAEGWRYEQGCLMGKVKLPIGAVNLVVVPAQQGDFLVLSIPFDKVRGNITGGLLGSLVNMLWKVISDQVTKRVTKILAAQGLPADTVTLEKQKGAGLIAVSLVRVNGWLARQQVLNLKPFLQNVWFEPHGVRAQLGLYKS